MFFRLYMFLDRHLNGFLLVLLAIVIVFLVVTQSPADEVHDEPIVLTSAIRGKITEKAASVEEVEARLDDAIEVVTNLQAEWNEFKVQETESIRGK